MATGTPHIDIVRLWPSTLLIQELPDHDAPTRRLVELAKEGSAEDVFTIEDASVEWLKANILHGVGAYLQKAGFPRPPQWGAMGRFDIQHFDDYRSMRNTPGAYLAGMYVLEIPSGDELGRRDDRAPGCITFYDPRTGINMNAINRDPYVRYNRTLKLKPGLLVVWPAFVDYFMHPNLSPSPAIRIAFEVQLRHGPDGG
jgi:hypothetical protein